MAKRILFTTLPQARIDNGDGTVTLRVSVFVSPRLTPDMAGDAILDDFDLGGAADNWPTWLQASAATFFFDDTAVSFSAAGTLVNAGDGALDPPTWDAVFPPTTLVRGFQYRNLSSARLVSYPVSEVHRALIGTYGALVGDPVPPQPPGSQSPLLDGLSRATAAIRSQIGELERSGNGNPSDADIAATLGVMGDPVLEAQAVAYYRAYRFYNRRILAQPRVDWPQPPDVPEFDFHEIIAALGDYPVLLRKLGLVLDYEIVGRLGASLGPSGIVRMEGLGEAAGGPAPDHFYATTNYELSATDGTFRAAPEPGSDLSGGMLDLSDPDLYEVTQMDVDGTALKVIDYAANMRQIANNEPQALPARAPAPSLRTAGIAVARAKRSEVLSARFVAQDDINTALESGDQTMLDARPLYLDDVLRGYRVDVLVNGVWRSLHRRSGTYEVGPDGGSSTLGPFSDEGYVKAGSVTGEEDIPDELYAHENVFNWEGWSLSAPRPGRTLSFAKDAMDPRQQEPTVEYADNAAADGTPVVVDFVPEPGTLPPLRFGRDYQLRARAVDLAGNSLPLSTPTDVSLPTGSIQYSRLEPVQQPILVHRHTIGEGESLEHMVIRSDRNASVASYLQREDAMAAGYIATCERHVAPPKQSQAMCELHGAFDTLLMSEDQSTHQESYLLALKEAGTFLDQEVFDPGSANYIQLNDIELISTATTPDDRVDVWPEKRGDPLAAGQYVIHTSESVIVPYLGDPAAVGMTLEDPQTDEFWQRRYGGAWPAPESFRLVLREGTEVDATPRVEPRLPGETFDVYLPQATIYKLRYSTLIHPDVIVQMGLWGLAQNSAEAASKVREGRHYMFTPPREITLVHAVQHPLEDPVANVDVDTGRAPGQTYSEVTGSADFHGRSTNQIDVLAHWVDPVDLVTDDGPSTVRQNAHIVTMQVPYDGTNQAYPANTRHEFGDTKHHRIVYQAVATTRYREYFPPETWANPDNITAREQVFEGDTESDPEPSFTKSIVKVLSSARPDMPKVLYIVPTFAWERENDDEGETVTRVGRGLRVYLDRPWYSSGVGELLGVTLEHDQLDEDQKERYASRWGSDPLARNVAPTNPLKAGHFLNKAATGEGVGLAESQNLDVDVAGFEVEYNAARKAWFCDIDFATGDAYFPFVRLVLCRYQPDSITGHELSPTVLTEFVQVAPDRVASVTREDDAVRISVTGVTGDNPAGADSVDEETEFMPDQLQFAPSLNLPMGFIAIDKIDPGMQPAGDRARRHVMRAHLEERTGDGELDWQAVDDGMELPAFLGDDDGEIVWVDELPLPQPARVMPSQFRIVVAEYEVHPTDPDVAVDDGTVNPDIADHVAARIVYLAHLSVPGEDMLQIQAP